MFTHRATRWVACSVVAVVWSLVSRLACLGMGMAGRRRGAPSLCGRWRQVRGGPASRDRHRRRRERLRSGPRSRRGVVRRAGSDPRAHGHDRHRRRIQGVAHASGNHERPEGRHRRRGRPDRGSRAVGRCRAHGFVRPSRHSGRRGRVRRPTRPASAAECPRPLPRHPRRRPPQLPHPLRRPRLRRLASRRSRLPLLLAPAAPVAVRAVAPGVGDAHVASCRRTRARGRGAGRRCRGDLAGGCFDSYRRPGGCTGAGRDPAAPSPATAARRR